MARNFAIVVGINDYDEISPLNFAKGDTERMRDYFMQEGNCATVERFYQYLRDRVPSLTQHYKNGYRQTPYAVIEPATKLHYILLPKFANLTDIALLREDALHAEIEDDKTYAKGGESGKSRLANSRFFLVKICGRLINCGCITVTASLDLADKHYSPILSFCYNPIFSVLAKTSRWG